MQNQFQQEANLAGPDSVTLASSDRTKVGLGPRSGRPSRALKGTALANWRALKFRPARSPRIRQTREPEQHSPTGTVLPEAYLLTKLPVELKTEICRLLHPRDLCSLVRTCKTFKELLLDRNNQKSVWDRALQAHAQDFPARPSFIRISAPAWVHLICSPYCHVWLKRYCDTCLKATISYSQCDARRLAESVDPRVNVEDVCNVYVWESGGPTQKLKWTPVADYRVILENLKADPTRGDELVQSFIDLRKTITSSWKNFRDDCKEWAAREQQSRRKRCLEEIIDQSRVWQWGQEVDFLGERCAERIAELYPLCIVLDGDPPLSWSQISPAVNGFFADVREERRWTPRLQGLEEAILTHYVQLPRTPQMDIRPSYIEFALTEECRTLVDAPIQQTITSDDFLPLIPALAASWFAAKADMLRSELQTLLQPSPEVKDPFELAVAVWVCKYCKARLRFPAVLAHPCAYMWPPEVSPDDCSLGDSHYARTAAYLKYHRDRKSAVAVPFYTFEFGYRRRDVAKTLAHIVQTLGLDPACALAPDLDDCEARLYCQSCLKDGVRRAFGWEAALRHSTSGNKVFKGSHQEWIRVSDDELLLVHQAEEARPAPSLNTVDGVWACSLCVDFNAYGDVMKRLADMHGMNDASACIQDGIVYVHPPSGPALMGLPVIVPAPTAA
ncbi:hypothetical protein C8Q76DRAFT_793002 [Earliella scabrosa]|nr:hypothetical protein C8Q76DRAFT_793002 [Earliella scabrosa]